MVLATAAAAAAIVAGEDFSPSLLLDTKRALIENELDSMPDFGQFLDSDDDDDNYGVGTAVDGKEADKQLVAMGTGMGIGADMDTTLAGIILDKSQHRSFLNMKIIRTLLTLTVTIFGRGRRGKRGNSGRNKGQN